MSVKKIHNNLKQHITNITNGVFIYNIDVKNIDPDEVTKFFSQEKLYLSESEPLIIKDFYLGLRHNEMNLIHEQIIYQNAIYYIKGNYTDEEKKLLVLEYCDKERRKFERLKSKFNSLSNKETFNKKEKISENVRIVVWRRDQGKCTQCGSREKLEYDHIIPISKGGSNTVRNIELLCESCNRQKSNKIQ